MNKCTLGYNSLSLSSLLCFLNISYVLLAFTFDWFVTITKHIKCMDTLLGEYKYRGPTAELVQHVSCW